MKGSARPRPVLPSSLRALRLRLTLWYAATFLVILTLLGIGMFAAITRRFDADLDASLRDASASLARTARQRGVVAAPSMLRIPDRHLIVYDAAGHALASDSIANQPWLDSLARKAAGNGTAARSHVAGNDRILRAYARAFDVGSARHAGQVVDRAAITAHVWDENHDPFTNVLEVLVRRLRRKIDDSFDVKLIHTLRGAGYRLGP